MDWLLSFDSGVRDRFGAVGKEGIRKAQLKWNWLVGQCIELIPGFEGDYKTIDTPAGFLEQIGLGNFIHKLPQNYRDQMAAYFLKPQDLYRTMDRFYQDVLSNPADVEKQLNEIISFLTREIVVTMDALKHLFFHAIDRKEIIAKSADWRKKYPCHTHALSITGALEDWERALDLGGDKGYAFETLVRHLAWHVLMSHTWLMDHLGDRAMQFELDIAQRLLHSYLMQMQDGTNLSGARIFARLERLGVITDAKPKEQWLQRRNLYKKGGRRELLDGDLAEFLVTGFVVENERRPLRVITCRKNDLKWGALCMMLQGI